MRFARLGRLVSAAAFVSAAALGGTTAPSAAQDRAALMQEHRGGTLRMVARSAAGTIDPQVNYTLQYWQVFQLLYDGLVAFKRVPGAEAFEVVPDLAEAVPQAENDGKTYTFK